MKAWGGSPKEGLVIATTLLQGFVYGLVAVSILLFVVMCSIAMQQQRYPLLWLALVLCLAIGFFSTFVAFDFLKKSFFDVVFDFKTSTLAEPEPKTKLIRRKSISKSNENTRSSSFLKEVWKFVIRIYRYGTDNPLLVALEKSACHICRVKINSLWWFNSVLAKIMKNRPCGLRLGAYLRLYNRFCEKQNLVPMECDGESLKTYNINLRAHDLQKSRDITTLVCDGTREFPLRDFLLARHIILCKTSVRLK